MYLHNDKDLFEEVINETNTRTGIAESIIEKDYYVTMILKQLSKLAPETVLKGDCPVKVLPSDRSFFRRY